MKEAGIILYDRIIKASNREYNIGLEKARERDLSGAIAYLRRALRLNKNQTDARNLLGLIYYEMGDFIEALGQWVISKNLNPENNRVDYYLDEVQESESRLEVINQNIKKYNQALAYAGKGSEDLAIMQLKKVLDANPSFVKGYQLLALLYINKKEYEKAKKALYQVLKIDKQNALAARYMGEVKSALRANPKAAKKDKLNQLPEITHEDVIIPPTYRENTGWQSILLIVFGLILGAGVVYFLVVPSREKSLNNENRKLMVSYNDKLTVKDNIIADLERKISQLEGEKSSVEDDLSSYTNENSGVLTQYNELLKATDFYMAGKLAEAAILFVEIDETKVTDDTFRAAYDNMKDNMEAKGWQAIYDAATTAFTSGDFETAKKYYLICLTINPKFEDAMYWLGYTYENLGDKETADTYYTQAIETKPNSNAGRSAKYRRGY